MTFGVQVHAGPIGNVFEWGGQVMPVVQPGTRCSAMGAGRFHNLALKFDGTVVAWGANGAGQSMVPSGLSGVIAIAPGYGHNLALVSTTWPVLQAKVTGNFFILSWPASAQNFSLQSTTNLADPNSWTALNDTPVVVNVQYVVTNQISGASRFYRLKK